MVMVTLDIPKEINKEIEHFKIERELNDKRDAIILLLKQCVSGSESKKKQNNRLNRLFGMADQTKSHNFTPEQIKAMDSDIYG